jgi:hypothetical protein
MSVSVHVCVHVQGTWVQLGVSTLVVSALFVGGLWLATAPLLTALGFSNTISSLGGTFATWSIGRILPLNLYVVINNALQVCVCMCVCCVCVHVLQARG